MSGWRKSNVSCRQCSVAARIQPTAAGNISSPRLRFQGPPDSGKGCDNDGKHYRKVGLADVAAHRVQALQKDGRRCALAHTGILSSAPGPDGKPWCDWGITTLVQDWGRTYRTVLRPQQRREIFNRFVGHFVIFLRAHAKARRPLHTLCLNVPWAEMYLIMEAIDDLEPRAVREGGRIAYLVLFGSRSWEAELKRGEVEVAGQFGYVQCPNKLTFVPQGS